MWDRSGNGCCRVDRTACAGVATQGKNENYQMFPRPIIRKFYLRKTRKFFTSASPPLRSTSTAPTAGLLPSSVGAPLIVLDVRAERRCACRSCGDHAASAPCLLLDCAPPQSCLGARAPAAQRRKLRPPLEESLARSEPAGARCELAFCASRRALQWPPRMRKQRVCL